MQGDEHYTFIEEDLIKWVSIVTEHHVVVVISPLHLRRPYVSLLFEIIAEMLESDFESVHTGKPISREKNVTLCQSLAKPSHFLFEVTLTNALSLE